MPRTVEAAVGRRDAARRGGQGRPAMLWALRRDGWRLVNRNDAERRPHGVGLCQPIEAVCRSWLNCRRQGGHRFPELRNKPLGGFVWYLSRGGKIRAALSCLVSGRARSRAVSVRPPRPHATGERSRGGQAAAATDIWRGPPRLVGCGGLAALLSSGGTDRERGSQHGSHGVGWGGTEKRRRSTKPFRDDPRDPLWEGSSRRDSSFLSRRIPDRQVLISHTTSKSSISDQPPTKARPPVLERRTASRRTSPQARQGTWDPCLDSPVIYTSLRDDCPESAIYRVSFRGWGLATKPISPPQD